jgi:3-isopropylmalate dehydratase small subunit
LDLACHGGRVSRGSDFPVLLRAPIEIDDYTRWRLMEGLDDISLTLRNSEEIARYEQSRPHWLPVAG